MSYFQEIVVDMLIPKFITGKGNEIILIGSYKLGFAPNVGNDVTIPESHGEAVDTWKRKLSYISKGEWVGVPGCLLGGK